MEISYSFEQGVDPAEPDVDGYGEVRFEGYQAEGEERGRNAAFRGNVGLEPVAEGTDEGTGHRIEVYPFYRDGAFLVARFDLINGGDDELDFATTGFYNRGRGAFPGFSVVDPDSGVSYLQGRLGDAEEDYWAVGPEPWPAAKSPGLPNHSAVHFSAPPGDVSEVTFNAGGFGLFEAVPIEECDAAGRGGGGGHRR
ncbi:hypothetical protein [Nocardiopsis suaedae]|uniref:DUF4352 domain-containing protein n=1 Tax=Nocardiopsis suaedae TaxID=3018444 RepID=A0ABT4TV38_9ACTN|nr:hypothetical protein [Nocardiopsis suaedae]MDA2808563.1 hypothetical protein [Nocardiopsis suaedae]